MENYFNYFTEIEECYRQCRGTPTLLSPLDWALIESWKEAGLPMEAVLIGVERAFQKYAKRPKRFRKINGLAYCAQSVFEAAEELSVALVESGAKSASKKPAQLAFVPEEVRVFFKRNAEALFAASQACRTAGKQELARELQECAGVLGEIPTHHDWLDDPEDLERKLSAMEDKLTALLTLGTVVDLLTDFRREIDKGLAGSRQRMTAAQIQSLERQYLKNRLFEHYGVPRLSLFYA